MQVRIDSSWKALLGDYFDSEAFASLAEFVKKAYQTSRVYPAAGAIFAAFDACPLDKLRVVIIGQDPYHGPGQAHGLCFSVPRGVPSPPSLQNIFKELQRDIGMPVPKSGDLSSWAKQGVLLLNAVLTVAANQPNSHQDKGWEGFTDTVISRISGAKEELVFMLWGSYAQRKGKQIDPFRHKILQSSHPSPLSVNRGFAGCGHFSETNTYLKEKGHQPINWQLPSE